MYSNNSGEWMVCGILTNPNISRLPPGQSIMQPVFRKIPVNVVTGFLGVGKTSAILDFLQRQAGGEKWAVLVNEFGQVGIDGALLARSGVAVKEVPGGCMCCAAGVPTRVALNQLIRQARPDRILIEPTGLGHPANILKWLHGPDFAGVLDVRATLTLVDPRVLQDPRHTGNENFIGQVAVADILLATKTDLCSPQQLADFPAWATTTNPAAAVFLLQQRPLQREWLDFPCRAAPVASPHPAPSLLLTPALRAVSLPANQPMQRLEHQAGGFFSCGWIFAAEQRFDFDALFSLLQNLDVLRGKAVMNTGRGTFAFNLLDGVLSVDEVPEAADSRIEFIAPEAIAWQRLEHWLLQTLASG